MFHDAIYLFIGALIGWHVPKPNWSAVFAKVKSWVTKEVKKEIPTVVVSVNTTPPTTPPAA